MTIRLTASELDWMRDTQQDTMQDLGYIQDYGPTVTDGEEIEAWTERSDAVPVGVRMKSSEEIRKPNMTTDRIDGTLRLPLGTQISNRDRVRIVQRYSQDITALVVSVVGSPREYSSMVKVDFEIVEPGDNR